MTGEDAERESLVLRLRQAANSEGPFDDKGGPASLLREAADFIEARDA